jgi:hypothetical protein
MKKFLSLSFLFLTFILFGQTNVINHPNKFEYSETCLNDYIVTEIENISKDVIYNKSLNWVNETYKNPDAVLKMKIENEKIRIDAIASGLLKIKGNSFNLSYVVEISFKDNKYRFEIISLLYDNATDYKKIPNFKTDKKLIKNFGDTPLEIENYFNKLNLSLKDYIIGKSEEKW